MQLCFLWPSSRVKYLKPLLKHLCIIQKTLNPSSSTEGGCKQWAQLGREKTARVRSCSVEATPAETEIKNNHVAQAGAIRRHRGLLFGGRLLSVKVNGKGNFTCSSLVPFEGCPDGGPGDRRRDSTSTWQVAQVQPGKASRPLWASPLKKCLHGADGVEAAPQRCRQAFIHYF